MKTYQKTALDSPDGAGGAAPDQVSVVVTEIAADMQEGLLALVVGAGLQVKSALMDAEVTASAGPGPARSGRWTSSWAGAGRAVSSRHVDRA